MGETRKVSEDHSLIVAAQGGDEAAFGLLVERYKHTVFATVVAITNDFDEANDISQEVFLRAWFGIRGLKEPAAWPGWIKTIARNRSMTWIQRRKRQPVRESLHPDLVDPGDAPDRVTEKEERKQMVLSALRRLPDTSSEALLLYYVDEVKTPRMAEQLGISEAAVRQRLRRARKQMMNIVEDEMADAIRSEAPGSDFGGEVADLIERSKDLFKEVNYRTAAPILEKAREETNSDAVVSMLLADAYVFARSREDLEEDRGAYDRAVALLDEVVEKDPENTLAVLRRAAIRAMLAPPEKSLPEQEQILEGARGGPYESVAELELARRYLTSGRPQEALAIYRELGGKYDELSCVLLSEMGVAYAMLENGQKAIDCFDRAVAQTTPRAIEDLKALSEKLIGQTYWGFWSTVDNLSSRQCQNHAWLAGLNSAKGDMDTARGHLRDALKFLGYEEIGAAAGALKRQFVGQMDQMFPQLSGEPELNALRDEIGD